MTLEWKNINLNQAMQQVLKGQSLTYTIIEKTIVVKQQTTGAQNGIDEQVQMRPPPIDIRGRIVNESGEVKVLDFGLATDDRAIDLGTAGGVLGTPAYMSPEQAAGKKVEASSDVFSAGALFYEMFTSKKAFSR